MAKTKAQFITEIMKLEEEIRVLGIKLKREIAMSNSIRRRLSLHHAPRAPWTPKQKELFQ